MKKHLLKGVGAIMALLMLASCSAAPTSSTADKKEIIIMSTEAGFAPYEYLEDNKIVGIDVDIAYIIADELGMELQINDTDFDSALLAVQQGKADFVAAGVSITDKRKEVMDFTVEYATSKQVLVTKKDGGLKSIDEMTKDTKIGVQQGTVAQYYLEDDMGMQPVLHQKYVLAAQDLKNDRISAILMDVLPAEKMVQANDDFIILEDEVFTDKYAIGVKKGNTELLNKLNTILQKLIDNGEIDKITLKHTAVE